MSLCEALAHLLQDGLSLGPESCRVHGRQTATWGQVPHQLRGMFFSDLAKSSNAYLLPHPTLDWVSTNVCAAAQGCAEDLSLAKNNHSSFFLGHLEPSSVPSLHHHLPIQKQLQHNPRSG